MGRAGTSAAARPAALLLAILVTALATVSWGVAPAAAAPAPGTAAVAAPAPPAALPARAPGGPCSVEEWQTDFRGCVAQLAEVGAARAQCLNPPTPTSPDSGLAGWFAERPASSRQPGPQGIYSEYGYAGYSYSTYDLDGGCAAGITAVDSKFETTLANGEFMFATGVIGASNAAGPTRWSSRPPGRSTRRCSASSA
jgi:hypothetical protein